MPRINKEMSGKMVNAALKHSFKAEADALIARREAFMAKLYDHIVPLDLQRQIAKVPRTFFTTSDELKFKALGSDYILAFNGWHGQWTNNDEGFKVTERPNYSTTKIIQTDWAKRNSHTNAADLSGADPLGIEWEAISNDWSTLCEKIAKARAATTAAIGACYTIKQLIKAWPEFEPFAKPYDLPDNRKLPVVQTAKLNELLDLPVEERNELLKIEEAVTA